MLAHIARTREGRFRYRISILYRKRLFFTPNASECASRTPGACFLSTARIFRTVGGPFWYRISQMPERRKVLPAPNLSNCQKGEGHCPEHVPECRREQENNSLRPQNTPANSTTTQRPTTATHSANKKHHQYKTPPASTVTPQAVRKVRFSKCNRPSGPFWQG